MFHITCINLILSFLAFNSLGGWAAPKQEPTLLFPRRVLFSHKKHQGILESFTCHKCHFDKVSFATPNRCQLCHTSAQVLKPQNHWVAWRERHGKLAQIDQDSCLKCHHRQSCNQCHTKLDTMNPTVHRPNFRLYHSVEVRMNPQSCATCHRSNSFCQDCHYGKRQ
ncbi:MAG: hypothetical protein HYY61_01840 [Deltaproteobacteria bacterium]|nr:hypothetical protein [Deltaproteobacteria bacterium]